MMVCCGHPHSNARFDCAPLGFGNLVVIPTIATEVIAGEKMILTAGGIDTHVSLIRFLYICPWWCWV